MRKRIFLLTGGVMFAAMAALGGQTALKLTLDDGTTATYVLDSKPVVTFSGERMNIMSADAAVAYERSKVVSMAFVDDATAIPAVGDGDAVLRYTNCLIESPGMDIRVFAADGTLVASATSAIDTGMFPAGVYIVAAGNQSLKIIIR